MRRVILTLLATAMLVWLLLPQRQPVPASTEGASMSPEPAVQERPASSVVAAVVTVPPVIAGQASAPLPDPSASTPNRKPDVGLQLREELKGVLSGGGGLSKYNPFDY